MANRLSQLAANYKKIADAILAAGPLVSDNLADLKVICERCCAIRERTTSHFGLSADGEVLTDDELQQLLEQPSVKAANEAISKSTGRSGDGNKGPFVDMLMQLVQLAMTNPQLLALILSLFKKTT